MLEGFGSNLVSLLLVAMLVYVVWQVVRSRGSKKADDSAEQAEVEPALCAGCGYDLRATPTRCPECGLRTFDRRKYLWTLANDWPVDAISVRTPSAAEERVELLRTGDGWEADLLRQQLLARGVACLVTRASAGVDIYAKQLPAVYSVSVYAADQELAQAYLSRARGFDGEGAATATKQERDDGE